MEVSVTLDVLRKTGDCTHVKKNEIRSVRLRLYGNGKQLKSAVTVDKYKTVTTAGTFEE
jgi:hypothetical protein